MELWDIYDENRIKTGRTIERGADLKHGEYRLVVHICIFNRSGEMLIQQRQPFKEGWSNMWDVTVGGSAISGETSKLAAQRELKEELGYDMDFTNIRPHLSINYEFGFDDYYVIEKDIETSSLNLQHEEVQQVKWETEGEILKMLEDNIFIPYYKDLISLLFAGRKQYGSHSK